MRQPKCWTWHCGFGNIVWYVVGSTSCDINANKPIASFKAKGCIYQLFAFTFRPFCLEANTVYTDDTAGWQYYLQMAFLLGHYIKKIEMLLNKFRVTPRNGNEWCVRPRFYTCKAVLGRGQSGLMTWILLWIIFLAQDRSLYLLTCSPARCYCTADAPFVTSRTNK